jgi:PAS domain S-box-containing protein
LRVVGDQNYPPIAFLDEGIARGFDVDLAKALAEAMGRKAQIDLMPWELAQERVQHGQGDFLIGMSVTEERRKVWDFATPSLTHTFGVFITSGELSIHGVDDLAGKRVAVTSGGLPRAILASKAGVRMVLIASYLDGFRLLKAGEVDAVAVDTWVAGYVINRYRLDGIVAAGPPFATLDSAIAVPKGQTALLRDINAGLATLQMRGTLDGIRHQWEPKQVVFLLREEITRIAVIAAACAAAVLLAAMLAWIITMRREISNRKRVEAELRASERKHRSLVEQATEGIFLCAPNGRFSEANEALLRMLGYGRDEVLQSQLDAFFIAEDLRQKPIGYEHLRNGDLTFSERCLRRKDGSILVAEISARMLPDGELLGILRDVTERRKAEADRAALEAQLRESQKMEAIGTLAGGIAHDFNNIIAAILGNADLAYQDAGSDPRAARESLDEIRKAGRRARDVVQQILSFSRRQPTERKLIALAPLIDDSVRLLRAMLPARTAIELDLDPDVPPVLADSTQIQQLLINLATNAMQAMQGRPGRIRIRLDSVMLDTALVDAHPELGQLQQQHPGRAVRLAVADDGIGMDAATLDRIFEPFFTTKPAGEGTGLGLSVVHGIVRAHEGAVMVESAPGKGTTFTTYLPAAVAPMPAPVPLASTASSAQMPDQSKHILYLDDDEALVFLVKRLLERRGYRVSAFSNQREALAALRAAPASFDLVVTDYNMPGMSGLDVAREVRLMRANLPVAVASGFVDQALRDQAHGAGVWELVLKAAAVEDLCEIFARLAQSAGKKPGAL